MLPQLAEEYKKYEPEGFHIVALERQGSSAAEISALAKGKGATFQMTTGGDLKGAEVKFIPHTFLFAADGSLAGENLRGKALEDKIKELLKESAGALAGPGPYVKLAGFAAQIKAGTGLGALLKTLATKKDSKDAAEAAEAAMMYEALSTGAQRLLEKAEGQKAANPVAALTTYDRLAAQFVGSDVGTTARKESDALKKDPKVKKEIEADMVFKNIEAATGKLRPFQGSKNPKADGFRKLNAVAIQQIVAGCQGIAQRYPGTQAAGKAEELINDYR